MLRSLHTRDDGYELFEVTSFDDLDLGELLPMIDGAWRHDYQGEVRLIFDGQVLRKLMPPGDFVAVLTRSPVGEPVAFELALKRRLLVRGESLSAYYASVLTVSAEHRSKGLGRLVLEGINHLVFEQQGADLIVSTFHEGHAGSPAVQSTYDRIGDWGIARFHRAPIWGRRLDKQPFLPLNAPPTFRELDGAAAVDLSARIDDRCEASFALEASLSAQYLSPENEASTLYDYPFGSGRFLAGVNLLPMAVDDRELPPIAQLQLLLAIDGTEAQIAPGDVEKVLQHLGHRLGERGCFALSLVDMGVVPLEVLEKLGFRQTEDVITFAARGPQDTIAAFEGLQPPFFLDFT